MTTYINRDEISKVVADWFYRGGRGTEVEANALESLSMKVWQGAAKVHRLYWDDTGAGSWQVEYELADGSTAIDTPQSAVARINEFNIDTIRERWGA